MTSGEAGFTLIEIVCVLAIVALLAAIVLPAIPRGTSRGRIEAYALQAAALLKTDRNLAVRRHTPIATYVDAPGRLISSRATGRALRIPADVAFEALLASRCNQERVAMAIQFFPSGTSCGGVITLSRAGAGYQIRVNWLTGGIEVAPVGRL
jgi:general secretion pathway protein H